VATNREKKAALRARALEAAQRKKQLSLFVAGACVIVMAGGLYTAFGPSGGGGNGASGGGSGASGGGGGEGGPGAAADAPGVEGVSFADLLEREVAPRPTPEEEVRATIAGHEEAIEAEPDSEMNPSRLSAAGNLYKQKFRDYEKAAEKYELLLADYPGWEGIAKVYPNLISCYEELGKENEIRRVCDEMMAYFPADSSEYEWARDRRGLRPLTPAEVQAAVGEEETEETP